MKFEMILIFLTLFHIAFCENYTNIKSSLQICYYLNDGEEYNITYKNNDIEKDDLLLIQWTLRKGNKITILEKDENGKIIGENITDEIINKRSFYKNFENGRKSDGIMLFNATNNGGYKTQFCFTYLKRVGLKINASYNNKNLNFLSSETINFYINETLPNKGIFNFYHGSDFSKIYINTIYKYGNKVYEDNNINCPKYETNCFLLVHYNNDSFNYNFANFSVKIEAKTTILKIGDNNILEIKLTEVKEKSSIVVDDNTSLENRRFDLSKKAAAFYIPKENTKILFVLKDIYENANEILLIYCTNNALNVEVTEIDYPLKIFPGGEDEEITYDFIILYISEMDDEGINKLIYIKYLEDRQFNSNLDLYKDFKKKLEENSFFEEYAYFGCFNTKENEVFFETEFITNHIKFTYGEDPIEMDGIIKIDKEEEYEVEEDEEEEEEEEKEVICDVFILGENPTPHDIVKLDFNYYKIYKDGDNITFNNRKTYLESDVGLTLKLPNKKLTYTIKISNINIENVVDSEDLNIEIITSKEKQYLNSKNKSASFTHEIEDSVDITIISNENVIIEFLTDPKNIYTDYKIIPGTELENKDTKLNPKEITYFKFTPQQTQVYCAFIFVKIIDQKKADFCYSKKMLSENILPLKEEGFCQNLTYNIQLLIMNPYYNYTSSETDKKKELNDYVIALYSNSESSFIYSIAFPKYFGEFNDNYFNRNFYGGSLYYIFDTPELDELKEDNDYAYFQLNKCSLDKSKNFNFSYYLFNASELYSIKAKPFTQVSGNMIHEFMDYNDLKIIVYSDDYGFRIKQAFYIRNTTQNNQSSFTCKPLLHPENINIDKYQEKNGFVFQVSKSICDEFDPQYVILMKEINENNTYDLNDYCSIIDTMEYNSEKIYVKEGYEIDVENNLVTIHIKFEDYMFDKKFQVNIMGKSEFYEFDTIYNATYIEFTKDKIIEITKSERTKLKIIVSVCSFVIFVVTSVIFWKFCQDPPKHSNRKTD